MQGGGCLTVGVAGLVRGGGFGSYSKRFGTAGASLLEAEVVTADGAIRVVNACREPALFWALKGGGGGTFGVMTRLTLRTWDLPQTFGLVGTTIRAVTAEAYRRLLGRFVRFLCRKPVHAALGRAGARAACQAAQHRHERSRPRHGRGDGSLSAVHGLGRRRGRSRRDAAPGGRGSGAALLGRASPRTLRARRGTSRRSPRCAGGDSLLVRQSCGGGARHPRLRKCLAAGDPAPTGAAGRAR